MLIKNIIVINGKEYDLEELNEEKRREIADKLTERALNRLGYRKKEKTA